MIILLTNSLMLTSWHDCWLQVARSVQSGDHFLQADLNLAAGAADASRAMLRTLCLSVAHPIAILAHAHFLSTAKPIAYR
jgi:hypothetical protein